MNNKDFIPYDQALALKELGFDEPCLAFYYPLVDGVSQKFIRALLAIDETDISEFFQKQSTHTKAPLYQQAFRWFREKHELSYQISNGTACWVLYLGNVPQYVPHIEEIKGPNKFGGFDTYEEAEQACLVRLIKIVKEKQV